MKNKGASTSPQVLTSSQLQFRPDLQDRFVHTGQEQAGSLHWPRSVPLLRSPQTRVPRAGAVQRIEERWEEVEHVLCSVNRAWRILLVKGRKNQYGYLKCDGGG